MNFKTTYFLFGLLAGLFVVLGTALYLGPTKNAGGDLLFPSARDKATRVETGDFTRIAIAVKRPAQGEFVLEKGKDNTWHVVSPRPLAVDAGSVSSLLANITSARIDPALKPRSRKDSGLDKPSRVLTFTAKGDRMFTLKVGDVTPLKEDSITYAESSDRPGELLAVRTSSLQSALEPFAYFRGKELLGDASHLERLKVSLPKKGTVEIKKEKEGWRYVTPSFGEADAAALITALSQLAVAYTDEKTNGFVKDAVPVADLASYGLDPKKAEVMRIEATPRSGSVVVALVAVGKKQGDTYYATLEDKGKTRDILKVPAASIEPLSKLLDDPGSLRNKNLVKLIGTPDALDVRNDYGHLEFRKPEGATAWTLWREKAAHKVDAAEVRLLIDSLTRPNQVTTFPDPKRKKELGLEKPRFVVTVYSDSLEKTTEGKKPAFKKGAAPAAELRFGNTEGGSVAVERIWGKEANLVMVPVIAREQVARRPLDYFDRTISPFNPSNAEKDVTKLEIERGGTVYEVDFKKEGGWIFAKPTSYKGRKASADTVREILQTLNRIVARQIEMEKADPKEFGPYGLSKGWMRAKVTLLKEGKPTTREWFLGNERPGKGNFARVTGDSTIYVFDPTVAEAMKRDMRDRAVLDFDLDKVKSVTLRGWKPLLGSIYTITAEKDGRTWTVKDPKGFALDAERMEGFLRGISSLKAEKFISGGKRLKASEGGLEVRVTLADKTTLELNVGDEEGGGYAATSNQQKGEAFIVPREQFAAAREKPAYFGR